MWTPAGEGVPYAIVPDDGDLHALDGEDAHETFLEVGNGGDAMEVGHVILCTTGGTLVRGCWEHGDPRVKYVTV